MTLPVDPRDLDAQPPRFGGRALAAAAVGLAALVALVNLPLLAGDAHPIWDADSAYAPWQMLVADAARALRLLLWNPWSNAGSPDGFDPDFGALSPVHLLVGFVFGGSLASYYALWLGTWWLAGVGMLLLGRWLGMSVVGASLAALAFAFSGFQLSHAQHLSFLFVYAAMPFMVWRLDVALCEARWRPVAQSAALFGLGALGGYPGMSVIAALFLGLWALGRVAWMGRDASAGRREPLPATPGWLVGAAALWGAIALTVAAPTTLGLAYEADGFTDRSEPLSRESSLESNPMLPVALFSALGPYVSQLKAAGHGLWPKTDVSSMSFYLGAAALWLALCGLVLERRRGPLVWLFAIGLMGLWLSLSTTLPLRGWLYDLVSPSRYFRHASMFRAWFELAIAIAAGLGWRELAIWWNERPTQGGRRVAPLAVAAAGALAAASQLLLAHRLGVEARHGSWVLTHGVVVWSGLLALAAALCFGPRGKNVLLLEVTAPAAGYAVVTDRWARGWKASVDDESVPLLAASFIYRAVAVAPGTHRIEMRYEPRSHPLLLAASWGTLAIVAAWSLFALAAGRRRDRP